MMTAFRNMLHRFKSDQDGYVTIEAAIVLPALLWLFGVGWVYFDAFHQQSVNQKTNYVIGDMISRETNPLDSAYVGNAHKLLNLLNKTPDMSSDLRVSVAQYNADNQQWYLQWSEAAGAVPALNSAGMSDLQDHLPVATDAEVVVIVETWETYEPVFQVGLGDFTIRTYSFTRPRYAPQIAFN